MRFSKCFTVLGLCLLMGSCPGFGPNINIGDFEYHLETWNSQNLLDYKLRLNYTSIDISKRAAITVRNGIPESSDPPEWLASGEKSTVPDFFSFIKKEENSIVNANASKWFLVRYETDYYHYPSSIKGGDRWAIQSTGPAWTWIIELMPLAENEEETWNSQSILDYQLSLRYVYGNVLTNDFHSKEAIVTVRNGIPESSDPPEWLASGEKSTIPEFFSFIIEEDVKKGYFFWVRYDSEYHYPRNIYNTWYIKLTPLEETEQETEGGEE